MKIAVCVKSVPDTEAKIRIAPDNLNIDLSDVRFITSPYDEFAIEEALKIKEKHGGETWAFSVGGSEVTEVLRDTLARGIDHAVHVNDPQLQNLDPLSTAKVLAAAIVDGGFDIILCGQQGAGGDNSQVPAALAELLNVPQVLLAVKLEIEPGKFKAEREIEGAHEVVEGSLPVVVSTQKGLNEPRYPSIKGVMAARRKEITLKDSESLGLQGKVGAAQRKWKITKLTLPSQRPQGRMIDGDAQSQAKTLAHLLATEAKVI